MAFFGMIVCLAAIIAIIILAGLKIKSKWLAIIAAVILSCVIMMPFSCCAFRLRAARSSIVAVLLFCFMR